MKKILMMTALVAMAFAAKADYLYWQIGDYDSSTSGNYNSVAIYGTTKATGAVWGTSDYEMLGGYEPASMSKTYITDIGTNPQYTNYFIELSNYNASETPQRVSIAGKSIPYSELSNAIKSSMSELQSVVAYSGGSYSAPVPEPTSGLMLMLGLALMGLKRKRA